MEEEFEEEPKEESIKVSTSEKRVIRSLNLPNIEKDEGKTFKKEENG